MSKKKDLSPTQFLGRLPISNSRYLHASTTMHIKVEASNFDNQGICIDLEDSDGKKFPLCIIEDIHYTAPDGRFDGVQVIAVEDPHAYRKNPSHYPMKIVWRWSDDFLEGDDGK